MKLNEMIESLELGLYDELHEHSALRESELPDRLPRRKPSISYREILRVVR